MKELLEKCLNEFQYIASSRTGSIGSINNVYLPQIYKKQIDRLIIEIKEALQKDNWTDNSNINSTIICSRKHGCTFIR